MKKPYYWEEKDGDADELLPRVHRIASLLKRWYYGTYHCRIDPENLDTYLNEFTFRFNRRTSNSRGLLFYHLLEKGTGAPKFTPIGPAGSTPTCNSTPGKRK